MGLSPWVQSLQTWFSSRERYGERAQLLLYGTTAFSRMQLTCAIGARHSYCSKGHKAAFDFPKQGCCLYCRSVA